MNMKRILAVILALMLLMAGCSAGNDSADASEETANPLGDQPRSQAFSSTSTSSAASRSG